MKIKFIENFITKKSQKNKNLINKKNLYIFPNKKGFQIGALVFFCFAVSILYQNNFALLISIILFVILFISILVSYQNLNNIELKLQKNIIPSNENIVLNYLIRNRSLNQKLNINFEQNNELVNSDLKELTKISFRNKFKHRGVHDVPHLKISSVFPFGIINTFCKISFNEKIIVYPKAIEPPKNLIEKMINTNNEGFDYEFDKIEENNFEKNLSKVSWKHFSIKKRYYHKRFKFNKEVNNIIIDLELLGSDFEKSLNYASFLINNLYDSKNPFSLKYKNYFSEMSCSDEHKKKQLTYLANVSI